MNSPSLHIAPFCTHMFGDWPGIFPPERAQLISVKFEANALQEQDFELRGVAPPATVQNASLQRRAEFLAGRICAQQAQLQLNGSATSPTRCDDGSPGWPSGIVGSITHSRCFAAAIVANQADYLSLGLDMEWLLCDERAIEFGSAVLTSNEKQRMQVSLPDLSFGERITLGFSAKETLFKALNPLTHCFFGFMDAELIHCEKRGIVVLRLLRDLNGSGNAWSAGCEFSIRFLFWSGFVLTCASISKQLLHGE